MTWRGDGLFLAASAEANPADYTLRLSGDGKAVEAWSRGCN
jgi:hypothetical protein